jgi:RimJ/RimL family protein N-acetyltransferase
VTTLRTERLDLRLPTPDDAEAAGAILADERVRTFLGGVSIPREHWRSAVERWIERWELNDMGPFVIERREDGAFVGRVGMIVWDTRTWTDSTFADAGEHAQPELGWALAYEHWGNGYATEAARAVRDWARAERGVTRLISVIAPANVASQRVAQRLGATPGETIQLYDTGDAVIWEHP